MNTLIETATLACRKIRITSDEAISRAKESARFRYIMIYDSALWDETKVTYTVSTANNYIIMPYYCDRIVGVRCNGMEIPALEQQTIFRVAPTLYDQTGQPVNYSIMETSAIAQLPDTNPSLISFESDATGDIGVEMRLWGNNGNTLQRETVTLAGTSVVNSVNSYYDPVTVISKPTTIGTVTVKDANSNTLLTLFPEELSRTHPRIRLHPQPDTSYSFLILYKKKPNPLVEDSDRPTISNIDNALLAYVEGDLLEWQKLYDQAQMKFTEASGLLAESRDLEKNQAQKNMRIIPEYNGQWTRDDLYTDSSEATSSNLYG